ncbi:unnamed protein product [Fraxinus pennsylvanica]|uniref:Cucumisin n=1 Tax=Fraxinus pennsylvanica TaxID=56036 RepID=A0AAD1ZN85_9LAMI|nr:unnamed protein product [Fraxinus pennsylvanica]
MPATWQATCRAVRKSREDSNFLFVFIRAYFVDIVVEPPLNNKLSAIHSMASHTSSLLFITLISTLLVSCNAASETNEKVFIVYMGELPKGDFAVSSIHRNMLQSVLGSKRASKSWLRSYHKSFNGFAAKMTEEEKDTIAGMDAVVSVFPSTKKQLHTTRSWDFMGFPQDVKRTKIESDVIVGMLDSGIWPESESFSDEGFGPPPSKWKGSCQASSNFTCNNCLSFIFQGVSLNTFELQEEMYSLVYGGNVPAPGADDSESRYCLPDSLDAKQVNGTIVLCDTVGDGIPQVLVGATGTIMQDDGFIDSASAFPLPASCLAFVDGTEVFKAYQLNKSVEGVEKLAPFVVSFSSRGPNPITRDILKPDLSAPGMDIVAAWSELTTVTEWKGDTRVVPYNIKSGTSMSCPHASGAAAYVKSFNPTWSPAAIKSALMTTAAPMSANTNTDGEFAYGSGHIDPVKAKSPGLVYDMGPNDYVKFLCGQGYSLKNLTLITGENITCTQHNNGTVWDLNYPSFALSTKSGGFVTRVFHRTVTNVGSPVSTYTAVIVAPTGLSINVLPSILPFKSIGQKQTFVVTVNATLTSSRLSGILVWNDGMFHVRSPIVAYAA